MRSLLFVLPLLVTGCANSISGEVNGTPTPRLKDAVYDATTIDFGIFGELRVVVLMLTDAPEACTVLDQLADVSGSCSEQCDDLVQINETWLGDEDYWITQMAVRVEDDMLRTFTHDDDWGENEFTGSWMGMDLTNLQSLEECMNECEEGDDPVPTDTEDIIDGTLTFEEYQQGVELSGQFDLIYEGQEYQEGSFEASACNLEDWYWFL